MPQIAIDMESIDIQTAIDTVKTNIMLIQQRIESIDATSDFGQRMRQLYFKKIATLEDTVKWLSKYAC